LAKKLPLIRIPSLFTEFRWQFHAGSAYARGITRVHAGTAFAAHRRIASGRRSRTGANRMLPLRVRHACVMVVIGLLPALAHAERVGSIRVMLHPYAAERGALPGDAQAKLESLAGTTLTLTGTTRTGALELALPAAIEDTDAAAMVKKLRADRRVLWAEAI